MTKFVDVCPDVICPQTDCAETSFAGRLRIEAIIGRPDGGSELIGKDVTVCGWVKSVRQMTTKYCFISINDGSYIKSLQVVVHNSIESFAEIAKSTAGTSLKLVGTLVLSPAEGQVVELCVLDPKIHSCETYGTSDASQYPLSKKKHSRIFLREQAHLRPRSFLIGAIARIRSAMSMATHRFFQDRGFLYVHTPIITAADCEGAGEMFQVTTLMKDCIKDIPTKPNPSNKSGSATPSKSSTVCQKAQDQDVIDYKQDFFEKPAFLTVSGQLSVESYCCSVGDVYTFGPTFRAEKSHTSRHLAEFWMIEPELAFADLTDNMNCAESYLKFCIKWALLNCAADMQYFNAEVESGLLQRLETILTTPFHRITYTDAVEQLQKHQDEFSLPVEWGCDLATEHERYLTEKLYKGPVIVYNYPKDIKAFYMRINEDGKTVRAMDVLLPTIGEVIGGSQREERLDKLNAMIKEKNLPEKPYWWYQDLRRYGTIPHAGFGLGFDRLIMAITGVEHIRDVIPFPRYPGSAEF